MEAVRISAIHSKFDTLPINNLPGKTKEHDNILLTVVSNQAGTSLKIIIFLFDFFVLG